MLYFEFQNYSNILLYSLDLKYALVSKKARYGYSCNFITSKLNNGIEEVETIEICQVMASPDELAIVFNRKNIPGITAKSILINGELISINSHADVVFHLAIPYWRNIAVDSFNYCRREDIAWIVITNLWKQLQSETETSWDSCNAIFSLPLSEKNYWKAIIESLKQIPSNEILLERLSSIPRKYRTLIPPQFKTKKITNVTEKSFKESFRDERKSAGYRF